MISGDLTFGVEEPDTEAFQRALKQWKKEPENALVQFRRLADRGSALSILQIARSYQYGHGVHINTAEAETWFRRACAMGSAEAQMSFGIWLITKGRRDEASLMLRDAMAANYAPAFCAYGLWYVYTKQFDKGLNYLKRSDSMSCFAARIAIKRTVMRQSHGLKRVLLKFSLAVTIFAALARYGFDAQPFRGMWDMRGELDRLMVPLEHDDLRNMPEPAMSPDPGTRLH